MKDIFLEFFETSVIISIIILAVGLLSAIIDKKFTAKWKYWIWLLIAVRLLIPFTPELNLAPNAIELQVPDKAISEYIPQKPAVNHSFNFEHESKGPTVNFDFEDEENVGTSTETPTFSAVEHQILFEQKDPKPAEENLSTATTLNISFLDAVSIVWILGAAFVLVWNITAYLSFKRKMKTQRISAESREIAVLEYVKEKLGINKNIEMLFCQNITSPMVMGIIKPKVILPKENYGDEELYFILCHELTHYRRHDVIYKTLLLLANSLHWFNPAVWLMRKLAGSDLEISCDSMVVNNGDIDLRRRYSETILAAVHRENVACSAFMTHFYGGKKTLKRRFINIFNAEKRRRGIASFAAVILLASFLAATVSCVVEAPVEGVNSEQQEEVKEKREVPAPSEETLLKVEQLFAAINGESDEDISAVLTVDSYYTKGLGQIEDFFDAIGRNEETSVMGIRHGNPLIYVFELSYSAEKGIILYSFDDYTEEYKGYAITKIYNTDLFYYLTDNETVGFLVPKYSDFTVEELAGYNPGESIIGATVAEATASSMICDFHILRNAQVGTFDWDYWRSVVFEDSFPESPNENFYAENEGAAVINGEKYYKFAVYEYDENKNTLPFSGTYYYVSAQNANRYFFEDIGEGGLYPMTRIYDSKVNSDGTSAKFVLGQGEEQVLEAGDTIGKWMLTDMDITHMDWPMSDICHVQFNGLQQYSGKVYLNGYIEKDIHYEDEYTFTLHSSELEKVPRYVHENFDKANTYFQVRLEFMEGVGIDLDYGEMQPAKIAVRQYNFEYGSSSGGSTCFYIDELEPVGEVLTENYKTAFSLGKEALAKEIYVGERIGEWTLDSFTESFSEDGYITTSIWAYFSGEVELKGKISAGNGGNYYILDLDESEIAKMPYHSLRKYAVDHTKLYFNLTERNSAIKYLKEGESLDCTVTVLEYRYSDSDFSTNDKIKVSSITVGGETLKQTVDTASFMLGTDGKAMDITHGSTIGSWKVADIDVGYDESFEGGIGSIEATFTAKAVTLTGKIYPNGYSAEVFDFVPDEESRKLMPNFVTDGKPQSQMTLVLKLPEYMSMDFSIKYREGIPAQIIVDEYFFEYAPRETFPYVNVISYQILSGEGTYFRLGKNGELKDISKDLKIGNWNLWGFGAVPERGSVDCEFTGNMTLKGKIMPNSADENSGYKYVFVISESDMDKIPYYANFKEGYEKFYIEVMNEDAVLKNMGAEGLDCEITVNRYCYSADGVMGDSNYLSFDKITVGGKTITL